MANKAKGQFTLSGLTDLSGFLKSLRPDHQLELIEAAVEAASKPIVAQARANLSKNKSVRTGALKDSIGAIIRKYPRTGKIAAFIGARRGSYAVATVIKTRKTRAVSLRQNESSDRQITPANYSHLVEYGHKSVNGGGNLSGGREGPIKGVWNSVNKDKSIRKGTTHERSYIAPRPFLIPAFESGKKFAEARIMDGLNKALTKETQIAVAKHSKTIKLAA